MEEDDRPARLRFAIALGTAFAIAAGFFAWQGVGRTAAFLALAGGVILGAGAVRPEVLRPLEGGWRAAGRTFHRGAEGAAGGILLVSRAALRACGVLSPERPAVEVSPARPRDPAGPGEDGR